MIADGVWAQPHATPAQRCRGSRVVLNEERARAIFLSPDDAETVARREGVSVGAITRIWRRERWTAATADLVRPCAPPPSVSTEAVDDAPAPLDASRLEAPPAARDSVRFRLSPSGRVALATIRLAGATRVVPADVARYRQLKEEAERRGDDVAIDGDAVAFGLWLLRSREERADAA